MSRAPGDPATPPDGAAAGLPPGRTLPAVAGAGTLLVPAALAGRPGSETAALAVAAILLAWHVVVARAGGTRGRGVAGLVTEAFGARAGQAVHALYFAGIAGGQAAVAGAAGEFAADGRASAAVSAAVLAVAAACAHAGLLPGPPGRMRHVGVLRLTAILLLTAGWWLLPGLLRLDGRLPGGGAWEAAAALVALFAWVGVEGGVPAAPQPGPHAACRLLYGPATAAALLALLLAAPQPGPDASRAAGAAGAVAAVVLTVYCVTNLAACGARWSQLRLRAGPSRATVPAATLAKEPAGAPGTTGTAGAPARQGIWAAAAIAATVLTLARTVRVPAAALLLGPGTATAGLLILAAAAALRPTRRRDAGEAPSEPDATTCSAPDTTESYDRSPTP